MILGKTSQWYPKKANMQRNIKITEFILGIQGYQYIHNYHVLYSLKSHYLLLKSYLQLVVYYLHLCQNHKNFIRESKHISWYKVRTTSYKLVCKSIFTYPLVNVYITMERSTILELGKSTISMAIFNSFLYVYQAGYILRARWLSDGRLIPIPRFWRKPPSTMVSTMGKASGKR